MEKINIVAYLKPFCGWSQGVRAVLHKYELPFEDRDIWNDPVQRMEMIQKSGQELSPCVEINGRMLPDISGEELEKWLIQNGLVLKDHAPTGVPINAPCADHGEVVSTPITLKR
jgi:monothiol glutaredoxin